MARRKTIFDISSFPGVVPGGGITVCLRQSPINNTIVPPPVHSLPCNPNAAPNWGQPDAVLQYGQDLFSKLGNTHADIQNTLTAAMQAPQVDEYPIYFHIHSQAAEKIYWETLCDPQGQFLALDPRWQIARIADPAEFSSKTIIKYTPPIKLMAILSAHGKQAEPEWNAIYGAVKAARTLGLKVSMRGLLGEPALLAKAQALVAKDPDLTIEPIPAREVGVRNAINEFAPHLLHFYCHGATDLRNPRLILATTNDHDAGLEGSIVLTRLDLTGLSALQKTWLVTLNCCEGSRAVDNDNSLVFSLIFSGVPAALGMIEPVDDGAAHEFSQYLYHDLFSHIHGVFKGAANGEVKDLDWTGALANARRALMERYGKNPRQNPQWALPVLYVRLLGPQIQLAPPESPATEARQDTLAAWLQSLPPDAVGHLKSVLQNVAPQ